MLALLAIACSKEEVPPSAPQDTSTTTKNVVDDRISTSSGTLLPYRHFETHSDITLFDAPPGYTWMYNGPATIRKIMRHSAYPAVLMELHAVSHDSVAYNVCSKAWGPGTDGVEKCENTGSACEVFSDGEVVFCKD